MYILKRYQSGFEFTLFIPTLITTLVVVVVVLVVVLTLYTKTRLESLV